jgi:hypothetical protein
MVPFGRASRYSCSFCKTFRFFFFLGGSSTGCAHQEAQGKGGEGG